MARVKPQAEVITTIDAADATLRAIGDAEREIIRIKADADDEKNAITADAKDKAKPFAEKIKLCGAALQAFFTFRGADYLKNGAKSIQLAHGIIGTRKDAPKVQPRKGFDEQMVVGELRRAGRVEAIRIVESLNLEEMHKWSDEELAAVGMERVQENKFFYKTSAETLGLGEVA